ncbi:CLUMA_CG000816, isoform A [Clunio marinus]|uniref:CLUMA_CG000816, isoform A n=1 Tax=Clunio marinus TaxID=568069 RepID=A0A1J1HG71_9DIPT|nr:CLUMA_CG000816, isoform A [Clunio marinus]
MDHETQLIKNLENQLKRLISELEDLEETKHEIDVQEYMELKGEFLDQTKVISEALESMSKGDVSLNSKYSLMKQDLRKAIATSFNTLEIIKIFGFKLESELEKQLNCLKEDYKLRRIGQQEMETKRLEILNKIKIQNEKLLSKEDLDFLEAKTQQELLQLDSIDE